VDVSARARHRPWFRDPAGPFPPPGTLIEVDLTPRQIAEMTDRMGRAAGVAYFAAPPRMPGFFAYPSDPDDCAKALTGAPS